MHFMYWTRIQLYSKTVFVNSLVHVQVLRMWHLWWGTKILWKNMSQCHFFHKFHMDWHGIELGLLWWEAHDYLPEQWHDLLCDELLCFVWEKFCWNVHFGRLNPWTAMVIFVLYLQYINPLSTVPLNPNTAADNWSTFCCKWPFLHQLILFLVYHTFLILNTSKKKYMLKNWSVYLFPKFGNCNYF